MCCWKGSFQAATFVGHQAVGILSSSMPQGSLRIFRVSAGAAAELLDGSPPLRSAPRRFQKRFPAWNVPGFGRFGPGGSLCERVAAFQLRGSG